MSHARRPMGPSTLVVHGDRENNTTRAVVAPIWQTATYARDTSDELIDAANTRAPEDFYARWSHPNNKQLESLVAKLENTHGALAFASGMAAASAAIVPWVSSGDHIVAARTLYGDTRNLLDRVLTRFGVTTSYAQDHSVESYARLFTDKTTLCILETPANPTLECVDIAAIATVARARGVRVVCDNTFASPYNTQPAALGAHAVFHSATKYLSGHSDVIAGVLCGDEETIARGWDHLRTEGAVLGPMDAWLVVRGLRTFALRMERHNANALALAGLLSEHDAVARVHYPMHAGHPQHALAKSQMRGGSGVLSVELKGGERAAAQLARSLTLFRLAPSLGGVESLVMYPSSLSRMSDAQRAASGISASLVRLAVGIEDTDDLLDDLRQALSTVGAP
ncbi:MAG: PLP-dependent aspartate aminotransferase family protein [Deltaproteobacteria bacterium]|nr:PLP-dependent aspartate aminotransferase family protein [Deltaproteobacteria bacterium]